MTISPLVLRNLLSIVSDVQKPPSPFETSVSVQQSTGSNSPQELSLPSSSVSLCPSSNFIRYSSLCLCQRFCSDRPISQVPFMSLFHTLPLSLSLSVPRQRRRDHSDKSSAILNLNQATKPRPPISHYIHC